MKKKKDPMKAASVRDLRYHFSEVEHLLRDGEEIQITKHKRVIAHLVPVRPPMATLHNRPDFLQRQRKQFGDKIFKPSGAELLAEERERF
jgi:antitoxin (DNA-binding transcriptional repressor) of toxin-antitoxin stability system